MIHSRSSVQRLAPKRPASSSGLSMASRFWIGVFSFWLIILTGIFSGVTGSTGLVQAFRLSRLLEMRQNDVNRMQSEIRGLDQDTAKLEKNSVAQEREIRRSLGYVATDEIVYDFSSAERR
jgi:hypothetical protein